MKNLHQLLYGFLLLNFIAVLGNCQSKSHATDQIIIDFETELSLLLKKDKGISGEDYKFYLNGINNMTITREFFTAKDKIQKATEFKETDVFRSIWKKRSIIDKQMAKTNSEIIVAPPRTAGDNGPLQRPDYYQIDLNSMYMSDLIEQTENPEVKTLFTDLQKIGGIAPPIISNALLTIDDFEDKSVKKYIALQFYYDFIFMMNRMNSIDQE